MMEGLHDGHLSINFLFSQFKKLVLAFSTTRLRFRNICKLMYLLIFYRSRLIFMDLNHSFYLRFLQFL